jgi:hypothetical protein
VLSIKSPLGDRLWIQRVQPKVPKPKALKRKRGPEKSREKAQDTKANATPAKRARITAPPLTPSSPVSGRHSRAAKDQAKLKLDAQARELAELNRQAAMSSISRSTRPTRQVAARAQLSKTPTRSAPPRAFGTRASARLRGPQEEEEWQPIPEEWLNEGKRGKNQKGKLPAAKTGLESDEESISDLTELSDDVGETSASASQNGKASKSNGATAIEHTTTEEPEEQAEAPQDPLENFVEWETVSSIPGFTILVRLIHFVV